MSWLTPPLRLIQFFVRDEFMGFLVGVVSCVRSPRSVLSLNTCTNPAKIVAVAQPFCSFHFSPEMIFGMTP